MPTLCHIVDILVPEDVDGNVHIQLFATDSDPHNREVTVGSPSALLQSTEEGADAGDVREQLEDLGYL
jgi:hypothetical protein